MQLPKDALLTQLERVRQAGGQPAYDKAVRALALDLILKPHGEEFLKDAFPNLDLAAIRAAAEQSNQEKAQLPDDQAMLKMMRAQIPNMRTQAHFNIFMASFEALRLTLDAYFGGDLEKAEVARKALTDSLDASQQVVQMEAQLKEIPEDQRSEAASEFLQPPKEFHEFDEQRALMAELDQITSMAQLQAWYAGTADRRNRVVSSSLRNPLIDAIRRKRLGFSS